jgi:hypothetical protein
LTSKYRPHWVFYLHPCYAEVLAKFRAKIGRTFKKAGKPEADEDEQATFCGFLVHLGVDVAHRSSGRIARVIKGELPPESLLNE